MPIKIKFYFLKSWMKNIFTLWTPRSLLQLHSSPVAETARQHLNERLWLPSNKKLFTEQMEGGIWPAKL
jgi:hypothetical protein